MVVIEMNPRVSRSSALASKATGFPIAKIAAKLAVGYTLDEIPNDITRETPACFEPTIDYCVVKIPRFTFEKFPGTDPTLIGRTFKEALQKGLRSLEIGVDGLEEPSSNIFLEECRQKLILPSAERIFFIGYALRLGMSVEKIHQLTKIDPWFLQNMWEIVELERKIKKAAKKGEISTSLLWEAKQYGFSDRQIARFLGKDELWVRQLRKRKGIEPVYKLVDTCAAEFEAYTPYFYSTYEMENET